LVIKQEGEYFHQWMKNEWKCMKISKKPEDTNFLTLLFE
jgi:hypothetical protein